jgi:hypothetical protein
LRFVFPGIPVCPVLFVAFSISWSSKLFSNRTCPR